MQKLFTKLERVFGDECEKYVVGIVLHAHTDSKIYADTAHKEGLTKDEVKALLIRGAVIEAAGVFYKPVKFEVASSTNYLTVTTAGDTTAKVFYSSEK